MNTEHVVEAYKLAAMRWRGCDWSIYFEEDGPNLRDVTAEEAMSQIDRTTGMESERWQRAARWLATVERAARQAEQEAKIAYSLAVTGYPGSALPHAHRAAEIEARYHRLPVWQPFLEAIEALVFEAGFVSETCQKGGDAETVILPWTMTDA